MPQTMTLSPKHVADVALASYDFGPGITSVDSSRMWKQLDANKPHEWTKTVVCHGSAVESFQADFVVTLFNGIPASAKAHADRRGWFGSQRLEGLQSAQAVRDAVAALALQARRRAAAEQVLASYAFGRAVEAEGGEPWVHHSLRTISRVIATSTNANVAGSFEAAAFSVEFDSDTGDTPVWARATDGEGRAFGDCDLPGNLLSRKVSRVLGMLSQEQLMYGLRAGTRHQVYALEAFIAGPFRMALQSPLADAGAHLFSMTPAEGPLPSKSLNGAIRLSPNLWTPINGLDPVEMVSAFLAANPLPSGASDATDPRFQGFGTIVDDAGVVRHCVAAMAAASDTFRVYDLDYHGRAGEPLRATPMDRLTFEASMPFWLSRDTAANAAQTAADLWLLAHFGGETSGQESASRDDRDRERN